MFKHILMSTDFGKHAQHAQTFAIDLARTHGAKLTLLHVYGVPIVNYADRVDWPLAELGKAAQAALDQALVKAREQLPDVHGQIAVGDPRDSIVDVAKKVGADLIVVGTHGRRGVTHMILGSVAESVIRFAPMPVLAVPLKAE